MLATPAATSLNVSVFVRDLLRTQTAHVLASTVETRIMEMMKVAGLCASRDTQEIARVTCQRFEAHQLWWWVGGGEGARKSSRKCSSSQQMKACAVHIAAGLGDHNSRLETGSMSPPQDDFFDLELAADARDEAYQEFNGNQRPVTPKVTA